MTMFLAHRSELVQDFVATNGIRVLPHPPYSPDLAPCDFWLFPKLKSDLAGVRYESRSALGSAIHQYRRVIPEEDFTACFREWIRQLRKCVEAEGEYFEKLLRVGLLIRCSFIFTGMLQGLIDLTPLSEFEIDVFCELLYLRKAVISRVLLIRND